MIGRLYVLAGCLALFTVSMGRVTQSEATPPRASFNVFPAHVGAWTGQRPMDLDAQVVNVLGVNEYVNRYYTADDRVVHLYVGYYQSQREGSSIHSPMNCLPGAGWIPVSSSHIQLSSPSAPVQVNRVIIAKGIEKQLVLYWYQSHGRVIASEYWSKLYLIADSIRLNRTDAALVRVIAPLPETGPQAESVAEGVASDFARAMLPMLDRFLPL